jgi:hypothetical protein
VIYSRKETGFFEGQRAKIDAGLNCTTHQSELDEIGRATRPVPVATSSTNSSPLSDSISINFSVSEARMPDIVARRSNSAAWAGS